MKIGISQNKSLNLGFGIEKLYDIQSKYLPLFVTKTSDKSYYLELCRNYVKSHTTVKGYSAQHKQDTGTQCNTDEGNTGVIKKRSKS
jgi:hypothetical protein